MGIFHHLLNLFTTSLPRLAGIGSYWNGRDALTRRKDKNALGSYINYYVAEENAISALYHLDKDFHLRPAGKRYWQDVVMNDPAYLVHYAKHISTKVCVGYAVTKYTGKSSLVIERLLVMPEHRRIKIGTRLLLRCVADLPPGIHKMTYVVPEGDLDTQLFLKQTGFKARLPLKENHFPTYSSPNGIRFTWDENQ